MEQRPLRLGDIVDDYCPRERRITNHAIVALVGEDIRQTRCTTCDGEHVYKQARVPKRGAGSKDGADGLTDNGQGQLVPKAAAGKDEPPAEVAPVPDRPEQNGGAEPPREPESWFSHRPLIRATLPRTEGEAPAPRPIPEFTMHRQAYGRNFRQGPGRFGQNGQASNGHDPERQPNGNHANYGNHGNHGNPGNGNPARPAGGGGRRRRRRGGRHKQSQH